MCQQFYVLFFSDVNMLLCEISCTKNKTGDRGRLSEKEVGEQVQGKAETNTESRHGVHRLKTR